MVETFRVVHRPGRRLRLLITLAVTGLVAFAGQACGDTDSGSTSDGSDATTAAVDVEDMGPGKKGMDLLLEYDKQNVKPKKSYRIGYLTECANDPYCAARLQGLKDAAEKYGATFKVFDANYNAATQLKLVQTAVADNSFDAFIFAPTAKAPACTMYNNYIKPTGKPVVTIDIPMCDDADAHPGTAGAVLMQTRTGTTARPSTTSPRARASRARWPRSAASSAPTSSRSGRTASRGRRRATRTSSWSSTSPRTTTRGRRPRSFRMHFGRTRTSR